MEDQKLGYHAFHRYSICYPKPETLHPISSKTPAMALHTRLPAGMWLPSTLGRLAEGLSGFRVWVQDLRVEIRIKKLKVWDLDLSQGTANEIPQNSKSEGRLWPLYIPGISRGSLL